MKFRTLAIGATALLLPMLAACGDDANDSGDRPSASELSKALQDADPSGALTKEIADCVGKELVDSDIPDTPLRQAAEGENSELSDEDSEKYVKIFTEAGAKCGADAGPAASVTVPETTTVPE